MRRATIFGLLLALASVACSQEQGSQTPHVPPGLEVTGPETWATLQGVTHVSRLWFAGQPDRDALRVAKQRGVSVVINLRDPSEQDADEAAIAQGLGLSYYNVPVSGADPFRAEDFDQIEALVREHEGEQVLIHCESGNRAAAWLAYHLVKGHGMEIEPAMTLARKAGVTKASIASNVETLLRTSR